MTKGTKVKNDMPYPYAVIYENGDGEKQEYHTWAHVEKDAIQEWEQEQKQPDDRFVKIRQR